MDDATLTFDPSNFLSGLKKITANMFHVERAGVEMAAQTVKSFDPVSRLFSGIRNRVIGIGSAYLSIRGIMSGIPEIGRTFQIVGGIIQRNFLWPLRQELLPILQKVLDWARNNRAAFVKWGSVLRNIFRAIYSVISNVLDLLKGVFEGMISEIQRVFGVATRSVSDMANIVIFKITAVAQFILITLRPVFDAMVVGFGRILAAGQAFFTGFIAGLGNLTGPIRGLQTEFGRLRTLMDQLMGDGSRLNSTFARFGTIVGGAVRLGIIALAQSLDIVTTSIEFLGNRWAYVRARFRGAADSEMRQLDREYRGITGRAEARVRGRGRSVVETFRGPRPATPDRAVTPPPSAAPARTVTPPTTTGRRTDGRTDVRVGTISVTVPPSDTPEETGDVIGERVRRALTEARTRAGER